MNRLPPERDSLRERYVGEMRALLSGDTEVAKRYFGAARNLVGALRNRLALGGVTFGRSYLNLPGGGRIDAIVAGGIHQVRIYMPETVEGDEEELSFPYLSGLYEVARVYFDPSGSETRKYATQFFPAFNVFEDSERRWYRLNVGFTDNVPWPVTPSLLPLGDNDPNTRFAWGWLDRVKPELAIEGWELKKYPKWPSMYTGTMRKVAQKLLGRKLANPFHTNCGIFIPNPAKPAIDQQRWVIEIVTDKVGAGVFAYPIAFFNELELLPNRQAETVRARQDTDRYDYGLEDKFSLPAGESTDVEAVASSGGRLKLRLLSADAVVETYYHFGDLRTTLTPWYSNWAFSYSGHEAQIVLFEVQNYAGFPTRYAKRFKLSIEADSKGRPSSASIEIVDQGWVKMGDQSFQLWAPYLKPIQEQIYFPSAATLPDFDSPLYVFYDQHDQEVVLRLKLKNQTLLDDIYELTFDCSTPVECIAAGFCPLPATFISAEDCNVGHELYRFDRVESTLCCYCERTFGPAYTATQQYAYRVRWMGGEQGETDWLVQCNLAFYDFVLVKGTHIQLFQYAESLHGVSQTFYNRVTLPLYEREGFFHYQSEIEEATSPYSVTNHASLPPHSAVKWHTQQRGDGATQSVGTAYTMAGDYGGPTSVVDYPAGSILEIPKYRYIGSIINEDNDDDPAVFDLVTDGVKEAFFGSGFLAVAVNEAFSGKFILMPESLAAWTFSAEYPVQECYRYKTQLPVNLCFIGDGTGDDSWRLSGGEPEDFVELLPKKGEKLSTEAEPIDLYAVGLPK